MRIVGHNRDYYDSARAYGADNSVIFARATREEAFERTTDLTDYPRSARPSLSPSFKLREKRSHEEVHSQNLGYNRGLRPKFTGVLVWFAGKGYRGVHYNFPESAIHQVKGEEGVAWYVDALERALDRNGYELTDKNPKNDWLWAERKQLIPLEQWLMPFDADRDTIDWMFKHRISIAISMSEDDHRYRGFTINCNSLDKLNFQTVLGPYDAFQELSMWIGGRLPQSENVMVTLSDKEKIRKHGFNKLSFRKEKQSG